MMFGDLARAIVILAAGVSCAVAQPPVATVELRTGEGTVLDIDGEISRAYTSNPETADVSVVEQNQLLINGKLPGAATLIVWTRAGGRKVIGVRVTGDLAPARSLLAQAFPSERLQISGTKDARRDGTCQFSGSGGPNCGFAEAICAERGEQR